MSDSVTSEILTAFSIICIIAWWNDWPPVASNEITTYTAACYNEKGCTPAQYELSRTVYRADIANRTVTLWSKDVGNEVSLYKDCAIHDKENWQCGISDNTALWKTAMHDGQVNQSIEVPWYKWWWLRFLRIGK